MGKAKPLPHPDAARRPCREAARFSIFAQIRLFDGEMPMAVVTKFVPHTKSFPIRNPTDVECYWFAGNGLLQLETYGSKNRQKRTEGQLKCYSLREKARLNSAKF